MKIVVITNEALKEELLAQGLSDTVQITWQSTPVLLEGAIGYIDLLFDDSEERIEQLKQLQPAVIIANAVYTNKELPTGFIRINGWNSFLKRPLVEAGVTTENKEATEKIFAGFNKTVEWVPDIPGFITARVISMIINEAFFTLDEKVSTKEEIDTAMKLGTNYPYGPFEWSSIIGLKNVYELLTMLAKTNSRYTPSDLLQKEALLS
jgi:3-hydroxybutyryl-CoA dehydrogenase